MWRNIRNFFRLLRLGLVLARHDALFPLEVTGFSPWLLRTAKLVAKRRTDLRPGQRLALALQDLGPTFIKLGQSFSTRSDLVGEDIAADLANLQDNLPPFPVADVHRILEEDFGLPTSLLFSHFEEKPVAAASIAQVHFATTRDGKEAAVKVVRPNVEAAFARDLDLFFWLAELVEHRLPQLRRYRLVEAIGIFRETVRMELDLRMEAASAVELKNNTLMDEGFYVPEIYWQTTSQRVLTMERLHGTSIGQTHTLIEQGHDLQKLLQLAADSFFNQVYRDGFFHADLHPGNMFVLPNGHIAVVDFGIMGRIDRKQRVYLAEILRGFLTEDYRHVAEVHFAAGFVPPHKSVDNFALACRAIGQPILGKPLNEISVAKLLAQLFRVAEDFEMIAQPQLLLLQKTMMVAEGVGRMLNPDINMWKLAEPLILGWAQSNLGPAAKVHNAVSEIILTAQRVPELVERAERFVKNVEQFGVPIHPDSLQLLVRERRRQHRQWLLLAWSGLAAFIALMLR